MKRSINTRAQETAEQFFDTHPGILVYKCENPSGILEENLAAYVPESYKVDEGISKDADFSTHRLADKVAEFYGHWIGTIAGQKPAPGGTIYLIKGFSY